MKFKMPIFNKKSDTWSLGCIVFLLLQKPNRPPFVSDDDIRSYVQHGHKSNSEFLKGLESISLTVFRQWVKDMLTVNHETRPSIESFGLRFGELLKLITKPDSERQPVRRNDFLQPQYMIGTDLLPKNEHALRWEEVFPLGDMEQHTGELNRAEQVVYARERLLGEEDPNTLWSKVYHAWTCHLIGDITQSINLFKRVWAAKCKVNGPKDVGSLAAQAGLAWCMSLVQPSEAVKMFEEVQRLQKEVVRENHPEILSSRAGLGRAYLLLADHYYKKATTLKIRSQRPGQWKALKSTRKNTDQLRKENVDKGISILEDTLRRQSHKCPERGKDHPETANTRSFLAYGYHLLGRTREAAQQHRKAFATQEKSLGAYHPETLLSCAELGWRLIELGELEEASQMLEKAWEKQKVVLGVNDSETVSTIMGLQKVYKLSGEMEKLEKLKLESTRKKRKHHPD
jgi:tetratricopeptide (TPR) repeat protein